MFSRELTYVEAPGSVAEDPSYSRVTVDLFEAISGDNNGDGVVDGGDLDTLSTNWSLPADLDDRVWTDGDTTGGYWEPGDGYVDGQDLNDLLSNFTDPTPAASPGETSAIYDWTTGEFWVSISGQVKSWVLKSPGRLNGPDNQAADILPLEMTLPLTRISNNLNTVGEGFVNEGPDFVLEPQTDIYLGVLTDPLTPLIDYDTGEPNFVLEYLRGAGLPKEYGQITVIPGDGPLGDLNNNGLLDLEDIDLLSERVRQGSEHNRYELNDDGIVDDADRWFWVKILKGTSFGDANLDGRFNSNDFVQVFVAGKYATAEDAGWAEGDWDGDGIFGSSDMVTAFVDGGYEKGPRADAAGVPEPGGWVLLAIGVGVLVSATRLDRIVVVRR